MSAAYAFSPPPTVSVAIAGTPTRFPVRRVYCVGRNYADHIREMGLDPEREPPFFFAKPADAIVADGASIPYPAQTADFQHEVELVVALGAGGRDVAPERAADLVFGYAVGIDLTRRDTQVAARKAGRPWEHGKSFDRSAPIGLIRRVADVGPLDAARIWLDVNGQRRQSADLGQMIWRVPEIVAALSRGWDLAAGDLIFTGTPAGIGALSRGDHVHAGIDGLEDLSFSIR